MNKQDIIELTNKVYKLTLLFPKKEPLRYRIREISNRILENSINLENLNQPAQQDNFLIFETGKNLEIIISYFEVAKWQNWVSYFDILEIKENYDKIKSDLSELKSVENHEPEQSLIQTKSFKKEQIKKPSHDKGLDKRKEKILEILKEKEKIQVWELNKLLPEVSKRTLRRDFEQLLKQGLVQRIGERNNTFYKLS
jgi:hypothetical protein